LVWFGNLAPPFNLPPPFRILPPPFRILNGGGRFPNHTTMQGHLKMKKKQNKNYPRILLYATAIGKNPY
jgi:hypothetical protein